MGRYYDEVAAPGLIGLDRQNAGFGPLNSAARAVNEKETEFFESRKKVFEELDFNDGDFGQSAKDVEEKYEELLPTVSIYNYKTTFDGLETSLNNPDPREIRYVHNTFPLSGMTAGLADQFLVVIDDDEDGAVYGNAAENGFPVLEYTLGNGKASIDPLYTNLSAFTSDRESSTEFYIVEIDEDEADSSIVRFRNVFKGFSEVPYRYRKLSNEWTQQKLGVMKAAGDAYEDEVRPSIDAYIQAKAQYDGLGGGGLEEIFQGDNNLINTYQDYVGLSISYNRPGVLNADLIKQARGLT